ncbi:TPA: polysaccharide deacetylase family protein [Vibrio cholerae]
MPYFSISALNWLCTILEERFGLCFKLDQGSCGLKLSLVGTVQGYILFPKLEDAFHQSCSDFPCQQWKASAEGYVGPIEDVIPAPSEIDLPKPLIELNAQGATIHYDIIGLTYWMLTRLEEVGRTDLDNHQRFPAVSSHAYKHGYLERPIVDEWLMILGQVIQKIWPEVSLRKHQFSIKVSHDVDAPSMFGFAKPKQLLRNMAVSLIKHKNLKSTAAAPWIRLNSGKRLHSADPYNTFEWLMDMSEANNIKSAFYFICGGSHSHDADYQPEHPVIRNLMHRIHERGHEIGLHPSYATYQNPDIIQQEAKRLRKIIQEEGIQQNELGGRMHYLRWEHPTTLQAWNDAGMAYDTTLSYADLPGFRCGTCFEYPAFNTVTQELLKVRIRPLIAMECTIIASRYMGFGYGIEAENKFIELKEKCRKVNGCFTLLWHNSHFTSTLDKQLYEKVIQ